MLRNLSLLGSACLSTVALISCSLTRTPAQCESTRECTDAFGTGYICGDSGLCELPEPEFGCNNQYPADLLAEPEKYKDYIVLGSLLRANGKERARNDSALLVLEAVNDYLESNGELHPEIENVRFGLVQCNHDGDKDRVIELANYLTGTVQVPAILGPASSSNSSAAFEAVNVGSDGTELRKTFFISPSATSLALTSLEKKKPGLLWRTAPTDDGQGGLMGEYVVNNDVNFVAIYEDTAYGRGLFEELEEAAGDKCTNCGLSFEGDTSDPLPLTRMLASDETVAALEDVDTIFFMGAQETHIAEMMKRLPDEFAGKTVFFSDAAASVETVDAAGEAYMQVVGTRPKAAETGEAKRFFEADYEDRHGISPFAHSFTAHAYDAAWLMVLSTLHAKLNGSAVTGTSIAEGMTNLFDPEWSKLTGDDCPGSDTERNCSPITLDRTYLDVILKALKERGSIDVRGASGSLDYDPDTEELLNSADAFEFWYLTRESMEANQIQTGMPDGM